MSERDEIIADFWRRFTDHRGGLAGTVTYCEDMDRSLGEWSGRVRAALVDFLGDYRPNREMFTRLIRRSSCLPDEQRMRGVLRLQAGTAFYNWLQDHGFPGHVAGMAQLVYEFHFDVREKE